MTLRKTTVPYENSNSFSRIALDIHSHAEHLQPFINRPFSLENFAAQVDEKQQHSINRELLVKIFREQYEQVKISAAVKENINLLAQRETFTITTGHQLCLFTGPLYFVYKIIHAIRLAKELALKYPEKNFVPVYWMASEDHDFAEICSANINGQQVTWHTPYDHWPVGRLPLQNIEDTLAAFSRALGESITARQLEELLRKCYLPGYTLAFATRLLVNELFGEHGLLILDADHSELKQAFLPVLEKEIKEQFSFTAVKNTTELLQNYYRPQINPREINLFIFCGNKRYRLQKQGDHFHIAETGATYTPDEMLALLREKPGDFSPNVALRPLYQEYILPNLAYIGGGGELAYWLQLKNVFKEAGVPFPILVLRNSFLLVEADHRDAMQKLGLADARLFLHEEALVRSIIDDMEQGDQYKLAGLMESLEAGFEQLKQHAGKKDPGLQDHIAAQWKKNERFLHNLENKLYRAAKTKHSAAIRKTAWLKEELFPGKALQERHANIFTYLYRYGRDTLNTVLEESDPENKAFTVLHL